MSRPASHAAISLLRLVIATSTQRCAVARLRNRPAADDALAKDAAHLVPGPGVDVPAQGVAAASLVDAQILDRDAPGAWPRSRPVNAIEHAVVLRARG